MLEKNSRPYRLGLDLGSNSLGWFVIYLDKQDDRFEPVEIGPGGVRIFSDGRDPQSKSSLAVDRRMARGARKRRDRFVERRKDLLAALVAHGLMPSDKAEQKALERDDPYRLRRDAITGALTAHQVGRAIFHLNQRRGFKSNRKTDKTQKEDGAIKQAASRLAIDMGNETLGAFFAAKHLSSSYDERQEAVRAELKKRGKDHLTGNARKKAWAKARKFLFGDEVLPPQDAPDGVRARATITGTKASYDYYPTRDMLETEFAAIWDTQAKHHPETMTQAARAEVHNIIFFQRQLKPAVVGKCTLDPSNTTMDKDPEGYRAPWWHPLAQRFRILQEVRNLEVLETGKKAKKLSKEEGDIIAKGLIGRNDLTFDKIRSQLKLPLEAKFNLESERREGLEGDATAAKLANRKIFGEMWRGLSLERQITIATKLDETEKEHEMIAWLESECGLDPAAAARAANTLLPDGHCRVGLRAIKAILPHLEAGMNYYEAAKEAGYDHTQGPTGEILDRLPYYGQWLADDVVGSGDPRDRKEKQFGQFPNPTVHIGLGQLRRVVNQLIDEYGAPEEIAIEFTRALKLSEKQKKKVREKQNENRSKNNSRAKKLNEQGCPVNPLNLLKMRLWEELARDPADRKCVYTGDQISIERLLSDAIDIDHIIPVSKSLDDSPANKIVCMRYANRHKSNKTPFQAFGASPTIQGRYYDWEAITMRASNLPREKRWRFAPDALDRLNRDGRDFLDRQLHETGWLARLAKQYLGAITNPNKIWVVPGRLTSMLRGKWALNSLLPDANFGGVETPSDKFRANTDDMEFAGIKNRADHRHHAIDALVIAMSNRSLLQKIASAYDDDREKFLIEPPWATLRDELKESLAKMVVSHRADHGIEGKLHEASAYGILKKPIEILDEDSDEETNTRKKRKKKLANLVYRETIEKLSESGIDKIRDPGLRSDIRSFVDAEKANGIVLADALRKLKEPSDNPRFKHGLRRVRILKSEKSAYLVPVKDRAGNVYKAYSAGENHCVEIFELANGKWGGEAVRRFDANVKNGKSRAEHQMRWRLDHPEAKLVMRIHKGDLIRLDHEGRTKIMVVHRLDASANRFKLAEHNETGNLDNRHKVDKEIDPFEWLMKSYNVLKSMKAEKVRVDELGRVWRVQPPQR